MADEIQTNVAVLEPPSVMEPPVEVPGEIPEDISPDDVEFDTASIPLDWPDAEAASTEPEAGAGADATSPAAPRRPLADLVKEDPAYQQELVAITADRTRRAADEAARNALATQQANAALAYRTSMYTERQNELTRRQWEDREIDTLADSDVIASQERRIKARAERAELDQQWGAYVNWEQTNQQQSRSIAEAKGAEQAQFRAAMDRVFLTKVPVAIQQKLQKHYPGAVQDAIADHLSEMIDALHDHWRGEWEAESKGTARQAARAERAETALRTPAPDLGAPRRVASRLPSESELNRMSVEKRLALLEKDPHLYEKVELAKQGRGR